MLNVPSMRRPTAWAAAAPLLCAIHCASTPVLVALVPVLAPLAAVEEALMVLTGVVVGTVLVGGTRVHRSVVPWSLAVVGLVVWYASVAGWLLPVPEPLSTAAGSVLLAGGAWRNARLRARTTTAECICRVCPIPEHHGSGDVSPGAQVPAG